MAFSNLSQAALVLRFFLPFIVVMNDSAVEQRLGAHCEPLRLAG